MWGELTEKLEQSLTFMEMYCRAWSVEYGASGGRIHCASGCAACCSLAVNCTLTEAIRLATVITTEQAAAVSRHAAVVRELAHASGGDLKRFLRSHRQEAGSCPLLATEAVCGVYPARPISCRALLSTMESSWCGADFSAMSADEKEVYMNRLDRSVVAFPTHYAAATRETGEELETRAMALMTQKFGFAVYGNMPSLLDLLLNHGLADRCVDGADAVESLLNRTGYSEPLLVNVTRGAV